MTEEELNQLNQIIQRIDRETNKKKLAGIAYDLVAEIRRLHSRLEIAEATWRGESLRQIVDERDALRAKLAKRVPQVRDGWKLNYPDCPLCGKLCRPKAHLLGDEGWLLWFECDDCGHEDDMLIDWPFESEMLATAVDFEALGFRVEP